MPRLFALLAAILVSAFAVTSACTAAEGAPAAIAFTLEPGHNDASRIHVAFRKDRRRNSGNQWSSDFAPRDLAGLDLAQLRANAGAPVRFAFVREAGRLDCAGKGGNMMARGTCRFTPDATFIHDLASRGIARPDDEDAFTLMAVEARRDLLESLSAARYPVPTLDDFIDLSAVGVTGDYIAGLARAGYRPEDLDTLVEFRALDITPEWIGSFARMGYANLPADQLVELKALDISAAFVAEFERLGYGRMEAEDLVQFKALGITPGFIEGFRKVGYPRLDTDELVQLKALGVTPDFASRMRRNGQLPSADRLVELRVGADILDRN
jgi:hypothetical protein